MLTSFTRNYQDNSTEAGFQFTAAVTEDGNVITGEALGAAIPFALALAARLNGQDAADRVAKAIVVR